MSDCKFTPPTKFPAEYVDNNGNKAVILGRGPNKQFPFIGYNSDGDVQCWTKFGRYYSGVTSGSDIYDIPKRITTWHNVYGDLIDHHCSTRSDADDIDTSLEIALGSERLCVYRIERDEDGGNPEIFVVEV